RNSGGSAFADGVIPSRLDFDQIDREALERMEAASLPQQLGIGQNANPILLGRIQLLNAVDPRHEALEAGRVHELQLVEVDDHLGARETDDLVVKLHQEPLERLASRQIGIAGEADTDGLALEGRLRREMVACDWRKL